MWRFFDNADRSGSGQPPGDNGSSSRRQSSRSRGQPRHSRAVVDPFGLNGSLFEYLTHTEQHGEAFAGYRLKGNPMVLLSLVDGTALASLHLRMVGGTGQALIARRTGDNTSFLGVLAAEGKAFELVMTNLTTDAVLMMDIGGSLRHIETEYWGKNDKEFWSGRHRNDGRLNRSNILWPMQPNVCDENNIHYQQTGVSRRLQLLAHSSITSEGSSSDEIAGDAGFPLFVYAKYGSATVDRFARTMWACPETVIVLGSPQLLGDTTEGYTIQRENPLHRGGKPPEGGVVDALAASIGVSKTRLLEVAQIDAEFLANLPDEMAHEVLMLHLDVEKLRRLADEAQKTEEPLQLPTASTTACASASSYLGGDASPAAVVAGERMHRFGGHSLLIEKFDFGNCSQAASLLFGVQARLQLSDNVVTASELVTLKKEAQQKIDQLRSGRRETLLEQISSVYETPECVICLGEKPNAVLYSCGHRCVHLKCVGKSGLRRCPLCRAPISAVLPESA